MKRVVSRQNPRLRDVERLIGSSRDRRKSGRCVLEGAHLIGVYCERFGAPDVLVVVDDQHDDDAIAASIAATAPADVLVVSRALFSEIATMPPDVGALAVVAAPTTPADTPPGAFCLLLDGVQDPGNVGSIIRTAAAAGVDQVVMSPTCAFAWSPKALRAGQGAHFLTTLIEGVPLDGWCRTFGAQGGRVVASVVDPHAIAVYDADLRGRLALAIGSEGAGVSDAVLAQTDMRVTIPMAPGNESLNAGAAAAVLLFEAARQRAPR